MSQVTNDEVDKALEELEIDRNSLKAEFSVCNPEAGRALKTGIGGPVGRSRARFIWFGFLQGVVIGATRMKKRKDEEYRAHRRGM